MRAKMLKKIAAVLLVLCMITAAGCGGKGGGEPSDGVSNGGAADGNDEDVSVSNGTEGEEGGTNAGGYASGAEGEPVGEADSGTGADGESLPGETLTLRIVDGAESGNLVLAGDSAGEVYSISVGDADVYIDGALSNASVLEDGMLAEIRYTGGIMEIWPMQIGDVESVSVYSKGTQQNPLGQYYDLCGLYLQVLDDLWNVDSGLNGGAAYVSVDLSEASGDLTEGEKAAIAWIFACAHDTEPLTLTYNELAEQGYLSEYGDFSDDEHKIYEWTEGVLFSITARTDGQDEVYSLPVLQFNAEKWRSPLGAYFFEDCKAVWSESGSWNSYSVGAEAIS
ncbi:MAG: hypothetical protein HDQ98_11170 [Lachnospiraceae bacterium]|nr:hypothetical protein [Lachnospiraceae bacterium]